MFRTSFPDHRGGDAAEWGTRARGRLWNCKRPREGAPYGPTEAGEPQCGHSTPSQEVKELFFQPGRHPLRCAPGQGCKQTPTRGESQRRKRLTSRERGAGHRGTAKSPTVRVYHFTDTATRFSKKTKGEQNKRCWKQIRQYPRTNSPLDRVTQA